MRKLITITVLSLILAVTLSGCGVVKGLKNIFKFGESDQLYYGVTSKQWLPLIEEHAKQWREDAYFYGISEAEVKEDGSSDKWQYLFYSPGSEKTVAFIYESGFVTLKEVILPPLNPITNFTIDSPTALNLAKEKSSVFLQNNANATTILSLVGPSFEGGRGAPKWLIKYYGNTGNLRLVLDATSGKILQVQ